MNTQSVLIHRKMAMLLAAVALLSACQDSNIPLAATPSYQSVNTQELHLDDNYQFNQEFSGSIRAGNTTGAGFELAGKINALTVDSGDSVKQGQLLAKLDTRLLLAEKNELTASISQNQADLDLAQTTLNRSLGLQQQGYVSEQQLDEQRGQLNSLKAASNRLNAALLANQLKIEKSDLLAPFDGVISKRTHNLGEVVSLGSPVYTLIEDNNIQAYIGVPVDIANHLTTGQNADIRVRGQHYQGKIAGISAELSPITRTVELRITLPANADVINGELSYLSYQQTIASQGYWVPLSALTDGVRGLWNIYVLHPVLNPTDSELYRVERRDVEIIYTVKDKAFINGAINSNEQYVSQGLHKLVAGQLVTQQAQLATR
ncbi:MULTISPECIES: efflux RND transporter periplasmic adaptor subunit [unclassified Shewanella]|uniref:efflux RND transporter periplasmic adaptor subunit n=1 Tax=unclassified Shewanella TaxID=196818 RepID=UPI001BC43C3E|nr:MULTISPECIES: efflux RND transporter periplasmic adaptor subunit [unclassified Shewanella]GIU09769.1 RND transporter MFP subunit [Shewanella sp. MBTL60-112-B1]GIU37516.1 RND transporter MFP subunit [Shewanella sp. MBTL60-112-B2]